MGERYEKQSGPEGQPLTSERFGCSFLYPADWLSPVSSFFAVLLPELPAFKMQHSLKRKGSTL
jgi:hypothetical protein